MITSSKTVKKVVVSVFYGLIGIKMLEVIQIQNKSHPEVNESQTFFWYKIKALIILYSLNRTLYKELYYTFLLSF